MKRPTRKRKAPCKPRPLSRPLLNKLLADIDERLGKLALDTDALMLSMRPNGNHIAAEAAARSVMCTVLDQHLQRLFGLQSLMEIARR